MDNSDEEFNGDAYGATDPNVDPELTEHTLSLQAGTTPDEPVGTHGGNNARYPSFLGNASGMDGAMDNIENRGGPSGTHGRPNYEESIVTNRPRIGSKWAIRDPPSSSPSMRSGNEGNVVRTGENESDQQVAQEVPRPTPNTHTTERPSSFVNNTPDNVNTVTGSAGGTGAVVSPQQEHHAAPPANGTPIWAVASPIGFHIRDFNLFKTYEHYSLRDTSS